MNEGENDRANRSRMLLLNMNCAPDVKEIRQSRADTIDIYKEF